MQCQLALARKAIARASTATTIPLPVLFIWPSAKINGFKNTGRLICALLEADFRPR